MRVIAMLQVYNEHRFIGGCIEHLRSQGIDTYLIDNESTDGTLAIAERYEGRGVIGIETLPRTEQGFELRVQCARQAELASTLDADWLLHLDADEIRVSPKRGQTLVEAIEEIDAAGYNALNFIEFTFVPTVEAPNHDHPDFQRTMRSYYPFMPRFPHNVNAWKRQDGPVELRTHRVRFEGERLAPESLYFRHYMYLSVDHAIEKYSRRYSSEEVAAGMHKWQSRLRAEDFQLPSESELRRFTADYELDPSDPLTTHLVQARVQEYDVPVAPRPSSRVLRRLRAAASRRVKPTSSASGEQP
jgi:glycosyltransferase involved in cell wall biosynthesis